MRDYAGTFLMVAMTTVVGIGCYATSAHGASERASIEKMRRQIVSDTRAIRGLQAELRTRARLPQLERWNENVLKMSAPAAGQFMRSPVQLASFVAPQTPKAASEPTLRYTLAPANPAPPPAIVQVEFAPEYEAPQLRRAAYSPPATQTEPQAGEP